MENNEEFEKLIDEDCKECEKYVNECDFKNLSDEDKKEKMIEFFEKKTLEHWNISRDLLKNQCLFGVWISEKSKIDHDNHRKLYSIYIQKIEKIDYDRSNEIAGNLPM